MLEQIRYLASWTSVKFSKRLGQRGAEMVEYAIVLACIVVLASWYYGTRDKGNGYETWGDGYGKLTLMSVLTGLWKTISSKATSGTN